MTAVLRTAPLVAHGLTELEEVPDVVEQHRCDELVQLAIRDDPRGALERTCLLTAVSP